MRHLLTALFVLLPLTAWAQVATDEHALDALPASPPAAKPVAKAPAHPRPHVAASRPVVTHPAKPATRRNAGTVQIPAAPPANPVLAPLPIVMPAHPAPPPPPVPVRADAAGAASGIAGGTRITFGTGSADLNPATLAAIRAIAAQSVAAPASTIAVTAWAPGTADDPSTPRRLSLDRALAVRAVLINAGIVSERIRAIAKGTADIAGGPPDRADVVFPAAK